MRKLLLMLMFVASVSWPVLAQSTTVGSWKTIDDDTGKPKSVVEIYERGGKYYGKVTKLFRSPGEEQNPMCKSCDPKDKRYQQPVIGMEIIEGLEKDGDEYEDGTILDPENGKVYDCKLWVEDGNLQVRGYISFLFRTQTWLPYK
ncbi:Uncharacterized conserved protein, DUF2147 family [Reichenbachiella agariperforans]|uniref:Uncharacterized conserved protein, DUF2147 family n=1 Tax=Reichenbachiella agariperforans TaxID=156994 RepID=A0A1M6N662_REIAG|nr:DUF2147 domain-containing protein [Reichenbachiella agariperforans]SHJ91160.1 Uncharacterized conserved protein, DUF2147 family [Reichenbachiella agariperforans]